MSDGCGCEATLLITPQKWVWRARTEGRFTFTARLAPHPLAYESKPQGRRNTRAVHIFLSALSIRTPPLLPDKQTERPTKAYRILIVAQPSAATTEPRAARDPSIYFPRTPSKKASACARGERLIARRQAVKHEARDAGRNVRRRRHQPVRSPQPQRCSAHCPRKSRGGRAVATRMSRIR